MRAVASEEATREEQRAYQVQLAHVETCGQCRAGAPCDDGLKIRRALQAARIAASPPHNARRENGGL